MAKLLIKKIFWKAKHVFEGKMTKKLKLILALKFVLPAKTEFEY